MRAIGGLAGFLLTLGLAWPAWASPWTLPDGVVVLTFGTDVQLARREFLVDGQFQSFPLDGQFFGLNLRPGLRVGLTDRTELGGDLTLKYVAYQADEAYFGPDPSDDLTLPELRDGILSFDRAAGGLADIHVYLRHRFTPLQRFVAAVELTFKFPTGYDALTDAFDGDREPQEGAPIDDVTLGDGQLDISGQLLLGWAPPGGWFVRLDAGIRARFFGPGQQVIGAFKVGRSVVPAWIPYLAVDGEYSFTQGSVAGESLNTNSPDVPAREFEADLVFLEPLRFDRTMVRPTVGSIFRVGDREVDLSYSVVAWGQNVARTHTISLGLPFKL